LHSSISGGVTWRAVHTVDEAGFGVGLAVSAAKPWHGDYPAVNRAGAEGRWNRPVQHPGRVRSIRLCHVALNIPKAGRQQAVAFYTERLGFVPADRVRDVRVFMRAPGDTDHHTLLLGPGARVEIVPGAPHSMCWETADLFNDAKVVAS
jgi:hypothetical protein